MKSTNTSQTKSNETEAWFRSSFTPSGRFYLKLRAWGKSRDRVTTEYETTMPTIFSCSHLKRVK